MWPEKCKNKSVNHAIEVRELQVERGGHEVLSGLTVNIPIGSIIGIIGPSGSGKTTFIRALAGAQAKVRGHIDVLGSSPGTRENRHRVAYLTQGGSVYPDLTARQNVRHFARLAGIDLAEVNRALQRVNLDDRADQLVSSMSGGQRARVGLASVLVTGAELLLLDEPTVGLDPVLRMNLWSLFARLASEGVTLVVSSHVMDEAAHCDRILLLRDGTLLADATPAELRRQANTEDLDEAFVRLAQRSES